MVYSSRNYRIRKVMKIATTTSDFNSYVQSQEEAIQYLSQAGFKYLDYSACMDYVKKKGFDEGSHPLALRFAKEIGDYLLTLM